MRIRRPAELGACLLISGCAATSTPIAVTPAATAEPNPAVTASLTAAPTVSPMAANVPSASPSPAVPAPVSLAHLWLGPLPPTLMPGQDRAVLSFTTSSFSYLDPETTFTSATSQPGPGLLGLESKGIGCAKGHVGIYAYSLSPGATILTISQKSDPCAARAAVVPGTWLRSACSDPGGNWCLGDLEAGSYASMFVDPRLAASADPNHGSHFGALTYTVPDGWANAHDGYTDYQLVTRADYDRADFNATGAAATIDVLIRPAAATQNANCDPIAKSGVAQTPDALVKWAVDHPGVVAGTPEAITIGGLKGQMIDVDLAPTWTQTCPGSGSPVAELYTQAKRNPAEDTSQLWWYGNGGGATPHDPIRYIFVDLGGGQSVLITIDTADPAAEPAFVEQAMPVIESFAFGPG